ncbi:MAG: four helix bundle protein [Bacteroidetes bacterium]|nr:MAG: four helix bundle protein [Bacteroidota bacterium]
MFDFEKLTAYNKAKIFNLKIKQEILSLGNIDKATKDQLRRASLSIVLNVAESTSRFSDADKRNFFVIARGSLIESIAILDLLQDDMILNHVMYLEFYSIGEELSKILYTLIRSLEKK